MSVKRALCFLFAVILVDPCSLYAQRSKLDCPRPVRERRYRVMPKPYLELSAGLTTPLLYRNGAGALAENYSFNSRPTPFGSAIAYLKLNPQLDAFAGLGIMQLWQGLAYSVRDRNAALDVNSYAGSVVASLPFGLRFKIGERWTVNTGAFLAYASHTGQRETDNAPGSRSTFRYEAPDDRGINYGLRFGADVWVIRRVGFSVILAADGRRSAPGQVVIQSGSQQTRVAGAELRPYLLHAGVGLSYRLFQGAEE